MNQPLGGPGLNLPLATNLYPSELYNVAYDYATNQVCLAPGENIVIPAGDYMIGLGGYLVFQWKDPLTGVWVFAPGAAYERGMQFVTSDGQNMRIANLTGCPAHAVVTSTGATYVQGSTTLTVTGGGGSTWAPIVGGAVAIATSISGINSGAGYGVAPLALIPAPPNYQVNPNGVGGVAASGYQAISSGTCVATGFTFTNIGAGYQSAPGPIALLPTPTDPNLATGITLGTATFTLTSASLLLAVLCTNNGAPLAAVNGITLAVGGVGVTASVSVVTMQTITSVSVTTAGQGYGSSPVPIFVSGGVPPQGTINAGPDFLYLSWFPRLPNIAITAASSLTVATSAVVYDGGLFLGPPGQGVAYPTAPTATASVALFTVIGGSRPDIAVIQPSP